MKLPLSSLRIGQQRCVNFDSRSVLVCRTATNIFAIENKCPHAEFPLLGGVIASNAIRCPVHGAKFDLTSGQPLTNPRLKPAKTYHVSIDGEFLVLQEKDHIITPLRS